MGRAIVVAGAAVLLGLAGCGGEASEDTADVVPAEAQAETETTEAEEPETTTTRPRPTTTTTSTTITTSTATTTTAPPTTTTTTTAPPPPTTTAPPPTTAAPVGAGCDPNYDPCVPIASDVDCAGGSGNGPEYVEGPVTIVGTDIYDLDGGGTPGVGCES